MNTLLSAPLDKLFSHRVTVINLVLAVSLLGLATATYFESQKRHGVSLGDMRMASWSLNQLRDEARAFDRQLVLAETKLVNTEMLGLRYDILWSRFDYLLNSSEALTLREISGNEVEIKKLFEQIKSLDPLVSKLATDRFDQRYFRLLKADWQKISEDIDELVIDNMVGGETGYLTEQIDKDLKRLDQLRVALLSLLGLIILYFAFAIFFIRREAVTDPITRLPNRKYLWQKSELSETHYYTICEIRNLRQVLMEQDLEESDNLIRLSAQVLGQLIGAGDTLVHVSYGQFAIITPTPEDSAESFIESLTRSAAFDWETETSRIPIQFVAGIDPGCPNQKTERKWEQRHQNALRALKEAQETNANWRVSTASLISQFELRKILLAELVPLFKGAPSRLQLSLAFQPIVEMNAAQTVAGAEVLLRARFRDGTFVAPNIVVDVCERNGLGFKFGQWLFRQIGNEVVQLLSAINFQGFLSINLNPALISEHLPDLMETTILAAGVPASRLCFEITEDNAALDFKRTIPVIEQCKSAGVLFALDDFGTGHSSLEYLSKLKIDKLKIDRSFVTDIENSSSKSAFLEGIIHIAEKMGVQTVVEGVENREQWDILAQNDGNLLVQGYYAHKPMEISDFIGVLLNQLLDSQSLEKSPSAQGRLGKRLLSSGESKEIDRSILLNYGP